MDKLKEYIKLCEECRVMQMYNQLVRITTEDIRNTSAYTTKDNNVRQGIAYIGEVRSSRDTLLSKNYRLMLRHIVKRWAKDVMKMRYWNTYSEEKKWEYSQELPWRYTTRDDNRNVVEVHIPEMTDEIAKHILQWLHWFCILKEQQGKVYVSGKEYKRRHEGRIDPVVRRQMEYEESILRENLRWEY